MRDFQANVTPKVLVENVNKNNFLELFSSQVKKRPNHPALKMGDSTLTYNELNEKAQKVTPRSKFYRGDKRLWHFLKQ